MCEIPKIPQICNYNRDKMVNNQNVVVWNQKHQTHKAAIFAMNSDLRYIEKIFQGIAKLENFTMYSNLCIAKFSLRLRNFRYDCQIFAILAKFSQS